MHRGWRLYKSVQPSARHCNPGKTIASGIPVGAFGFSEEFGEKATKVLESVYGLAKGVGGTLAANAFTMAVMRATLSEVLTEDFYRRNIPLATRFNDGVKAVINEFNLPWNTTQLGCRTEYWFRKESAKNGFEAANGLDFDLDWYMHLACLNRGY